MINNEKLDFLKELISINNNCYYWRFSSEIDQILESNVSIAKIIYDTFLDLPTIQLITEYFSNNHHPLCFTDAFDFMWFACIEYDGAFQYIHLVGPNAVNDYPFQLLRKKLFSLDLSIKKKNTIDAFTKDIPMIPLRKFLSFCQMYHYALHQEKITIADITFRNSNHSHFNPDDNQTTQTHVGVWATEQKLMDHVENGNLNWKDTINEVSSLSYGVKMADHNSLRQGKNSVIIFTSICARAAVRGGLPPSTAYNLNDYYVQSAEHCATMAEITNLSHTMYEDYILRVNKIKYKPNVSKIIRGCCDFIDLHIYEPLTLDLISKHIGYSKYYLTRRFKKEMDISLNDYIKDRKINAAKVLLLTEELSILDISIKLHFSSRNYFSSVFQEATGLSPTEYKKKNCE